MEIVERIAAAGASEQTIEAFQGRFGVELPNDYRLFLQEFNGGRPSPRDFDAADGEEGSSVQFFFTLDEDSPHYVLTREVERFQDRIPKNTIPVACDSFGNLVLLDVGARKLGAIYFWDHEEEEFEAEPTWDNVHLVTETFQQFVAALQ